MSKHLPVHTINNIKVHNFEWSIFLAAQSMCHYMIWKRSLLTETSRIAITADLNCIQEGKRLCGPLLITCVIPIQGMLECIGCMHCRVTADLDRIQLPKHRCVVPFQVFHLPCLASSPTPEKHMSSECPALYLPSMPRCPGAVQMAPGAHA